ncbi:hypothetical protein [Alkalihalobacterium elongatum]|uniref:hypothetical protein n=1 Tax=Alkalihalobacterium elongatum TaxID=2675466 RepID=UPI001C20112C|nr:hypothetical protein [Alkalihalobacterium elongatum]
MLRNKSPYLSFFISSMVLLGVGFSLAGTFLTSDVSNDARSFNSSEDIPLMIPADINSLDDEQLEKFFKVLERMDNLRENVKNDFVRTHELDLQEYEYLPNDLVYDGKGAYHNLASVISRVISTQTYGDILPYVYYNKNNQHVLIFDKKSNGDNLLHIRKFNGEQWEFVDRISTPGVKMIDKHWENVIIEK